MASAVLWTFHFWLKWNGWKIFAWRGKCQHQNCFLEAQVHKRAFRVEIHFQWLPVTTFSQKQTIHMQGLTVPSPTTDNIWHPKAAPSSAEIAGQRPPSHSPLTTLDFPNYTDYTGSGHAWHFLPLPLQSKSPSPPPILTFQLLEQFPSPALLGGDV